MGIRRKRDALTALPLGMTQYPSYSRLGGPQGRSGPVRKISPPPGFDPSTVESLTSRYTSPHSGILQTHIHLLHAKFRPTPQHVTDVCKCMLQHYSRISVLHFVQVHKYFHTLSGGRVGQPHNALCRHPILR
jgi:hypothetical protein